MTKTLIRTNKARNNRGFTLVEMLVVLFVIVTISTLVLINYRQGQRRLALQNVVQQLLLDIRRAQNMALQAMSYNSVTPQRYGIYLSTTSTYYVLFADCSGGTDFRYNEPGTCGNSSNKPEKIEEITLPANIRIMNIFSDAVPPSPANITFEPPDPTTCIYNPGDGGCVDQAIIQLVNMANADSVNIVVTRTGLAEIQ